MRVIAEWAGGVDIAVDGEVGAHAALRALVHVFGEKDIARLSGADITV